MDRESKAKARDKIIKGLLDVDSKVAYITKDSELLSVDKLIVTNDIHKKINELLNIINSI